MSPPRQHPRELRHGARAVTSSCGAVAPVSRLARLICVLLSVVSAIFTSPLPVTSDVTSISVHVPPVIGPDVPAMVGENAGALTNVIADSVHELSATAWTR